MSKDVVETIYGKYSKYEVVKDTTIFGTTFHIRKDGERHKGGYKSLTSAVAAARKDAKH